jgi:hypothetical protein
MRCAQREGYSEHLDVLLSSAGLLHLKTELTDAEGKVRQPSGAQIPRQEEWTLNLKLTEKIVSTSVEERARCIELKVQPKLRDCSRVVEASDGLRSRHH